MPASYLRNIAVRIVIQGGYLRGSVHTPIARLVCREFAATPPDIRDSRGSWLRRDANARAVDYCDRNGCLHVFDCDLCGAQMAKVIYEDVECITDEDVDPDEWYRGEISKEWADASTDVYRDPKDPKWVNRDREGNGDQWLLESDLGDLAAHHVCLRCCCVSVIECCGRACVISGVESFLSHTRLDVSHLNVTMIYYGPPAIVDNPAYADHFESGSLLGPDGGYPVVVKCRRCQKEYRMNDK